MASTSIITIGLVNHWCFSDEYIQFDPSAITDKPHITTTIDVERAAGVVRIYSVRSQWKIENELATLTLEYDAELNPKYHDEPDADEYWGTASITVDTVGWTAKATWTGTHTDYWDGTVEAEVIRGGLTETKKRIATTKLERHQQQLRTALLSLDSKCAITGEDLPEVLDAAHIIGAADGGREVIENAVLLRADLHRLLDNGLITIDIDGKVLGAHGLPKRYESAITGKALPSQVFSRVKEALLVVTQYQKSKSL